MSMMAELKKVLAQLKTDSGASICAIVSRNGIPIAYDAPEGSHMDTFSTLSATILGASEVIYSGLKKEKPEMVLARSPSGTLIARPIGVKALLVVLGDRPPEELAPIVGKAAESIREVLKYEH